MLKIIDPYPHGRRIFSPFCPELFQRLPGGLKRHGSVDCACVAAEILVVSGGDVPQAVALQIPVFALTVSVVRFMVEWSLFAKKTIRLCE